MERFLYVLLVVVTWFASAIGSYVAGRIVLPEVGLIAPGFWTWFWMVGVLIIFGTVVKICTEVMEEMTS